MVGVQIVLISNAQIAFISASLKMFLDNLDNVRLNRSAGDSSATRFEQSLNPTILKQASIYVNYTHTISWKHDMFIPDDTSA